MANIRMLVCWILLGIMAGLIIVVVSPLRELLQIPGDLSNYVIHLGVLGVLLLIMVILTKMTMWLRIFMITAGTSALGWPISLYIHDLISPLFPDEGFTYLLVFFILPVTFLIGVSGSIVIGIKQLVSSK